MTRPFALRIKRLLDVLGAVLGFIVLSPVLALASLAVLRSLGRPILFRQLRTGRHGKSFWIYKFRTMRPPREGEVWFRTDDERLSRAGRVLRRTSIDELPELWNVIRGEMSLVGPRPLLPEYLTAYTPKQARRHEMRPGITGWAQVQGRQSIPFSRRLELDVWYIDHFSLALDLRIIAMTVRDVLLTRGVKPGQDITEIDDLDLAGRALERPATSAPATSAPAASSRTASSDGSGRAP